MRKTWTIVSILLLALSLSACEPEPVVGSEKWCDSMADRPNGEWTVNEAKAFTKHCVFENYVEDEED